MHAPLALSLAVLALAPVSTPLGAQSDYTLAFDAGGTRWRVEARFPGRGEETLEFWIPLWTPGAYHEAEYGRFVKELRAADEEGHALAVEREGSSRFVVRGTAAAKEIVLAYEAEPISEEIFSHGIIDVESNRITSAYAYVNPPSLFGFVRARMDEPVRLALTLPAGWKAATVLPQDEAGRYLAPSYLRFEDSPFLFSPTLTTATFDVAGRPHAVSVHGREEEDVQALAAGCARIVAAGAELMGALPYERYHFLYGFVPEAGGSGLEHGDSTLILVNEDLEIDEGTAELWNLTAHEFFHLWCAERIHVEAIRTPDLTEPIETGTLWLNEGITEYFCRHLLLHAGFFDETELLASFFAHTIPPGAIPKRSWTDVSRATGSWAGMGDLMQFALRMYAVGPPTILALDLTMRRATDGERGVYDLVHHLYAEYAAEGRGFGEDELDDVLAEIAGGEAVAFYARFIDGPEIPDPAQHLDVIGYRYDAKAGVVPLSDPTAAQLEARRDFFSKTGRP